VTIAILLPTPEGIVLGTDSTVTVSQGGQVAQLYNSAQKIFEIGPVMEGKFVAGEDFSGGVAFYSAGSFGPTSWRSLVSDFYRERVRTRQDMPNPPTEFLAFAQAKWAEMQASGVVQSTQPIPEGGFLFATVSKASGFVQGARVELQKATVEPSMLNNIQIGGGFDVVSRLLLGYDNGLEPALASAGFDMAKFGVIAQQFKAMPETASLPLRDAIDFVHFLAYSAIKLHRYRGGPAQIGGAIEIAAVTPDRGFRWIVHKPMRDSIGIAKGVMP